MLRVDGCFNGRVAGLLEGHRAIPSQSAAVSLFGTLAIHCGHVDC
jgi:hypothetical protein